MLVVQANADPVGICLTLDADLEDAADAIEDAALAEDTLLTLATLDLDADATLVALLRELSDADLEDTTDAL